MTPQTGQIELGSVEPQVLHTSAPSMEPESHLLSARAAHLARNLAWIPGQQESHQLRNRCEKLSRTSQPLLALRESRAQKDSSDDFRYLQDNMFLFAGELQQICETFQLPHALPLARLSNGAVIPRIAAIAEDYLAGNGYQFSETSFTFYIRGFQEITVLKMDELWMLIPALKLALLAQISDCGLRLLKNTAADYDIRTLIRSLQDIKQTQWKVIIEPLILFDGVLRQDPAGAYARMDYDSRELYRKRLVSIAERCDCSEIKVAEEIIALACEAHARPDEDPRVTLRNSHVGSYLLAEGSSALKERVGFHPTFA
jgi:cyclic beta-1,2-glucan synthetase